MFAFQIIIVRRIANRRPDPCLYTFMQCINVYKKYRPGRSQVDIFYVDKKFMWIYVDIKIYRPGRDVYVNFMFLHKRVYYMYAFMRVSAGIQYKCTTLPYWHFYGIVRLTRTRAEPALLTAALATVTYGSMQHSAPVVCPFYSKIFLCSER
jgi:hypothetical protein